MREGIQMIREVTHKPISVGPAKQYNTGFWLPFLQEGDQFQVHWYHTMEQEKDEPYLSFLTNVQALNVPKKTSVILGEAQANIGDENIMDDVMKKAHDCGYEGVLFWFDNNTKDPKYKFDSTKFQEIREKKD